jgi:hypothetical protein
MAKIHKVEYDFWYENELDLSIENLIPYDESHIFADSMWYRKWETDKEVENLQRELYFAFIKPIYNDFLNWIVSKFRIDGEPMHFEIKESIRRKYELI